MSFFKEIADSLTTAVGAVSGGYNYIGYGGRAIYIEGVKRVLSIAPESMTFDCGKVRLNVSGAELTVSELEDGCVTVTGKVSSVAEEVK